MIHMLGCRIRVRELRHSLTGPRVAQPWVESTPASNFADKRGSTRVAQQSSYPLWH